MVSEVDKPSPGAQIAMSNDLDDNGTVTFTAKWANDSWQLERVRICPGPRFATSCGSSIDYQGNRFQLEPAYPGVDYGVASYLGVGEILGCSRNGIGPIGIYGASEQPANEAVTVSRTDGVRKYIADAR